MVKIPNHVMTFAEGNTDLYMGFADYFKHNASMKHKMENLVFNGQVQFSEKEAEINKLFSEEVKRVSGVPFAFSDKIMATNPQVTWAAFAIVNKLIDVVLPETIVQSMGIYTNVQTISAGDSLAIDIMPRDLFTVTKAGRGKRHGEAQKQFKGQVTIIPEYRDVTVTVSFYRVLAGKESLADFVMKAVRSIETEMTYDAYTAFTTAMNALPTTPSGGELKVTGWTQDAGVQLAQRVTAFNNGNKAVFVGTQVALSKILPAGSNYRYMLDSEYVKVGYIQTAFGYDVMVLPQIADWKNPHKTFLKDNEIYVMSPSAGKLIQLAIGDEGYTVTDEPLANADLTQRATIKKSWGIGVATNAIYGLITVS